jgi:hypothetical protein
MLYRAASDRHGTYMKRLFARLRGGGPELHVADPRFDDWEVVRDFEDLKTAKAWCRHAEHAGFEAVLTADWPLDRFGQGDIALRVPPGRWSDAEDFVSGLDLE